ncbi:MAG: ABC transporter ATP-binding protein [Lachnospiraceae bacterium]|nr:ABC transporter ATP-binding protein [Lachnospiraceae bacterium]
MDEKKKTVIEVREAKKIYRMGQEKIKAVDGVSFTVEEGEFCCLLGTSGSGKSTLLNLMAGIEKLTKGEILIKGKSIGKMNENKLAKFRQDNLGFVFQSYNLIGSMTALENVEFPLVFKRIGTGKRRKMATEMLRNVGLGGRMQHKPKEMSGGQQQRVGIARAFVAKPAIVFADEPTGNLDSKTTLEVMDMLKAMARKNNQTVVMVTHDRKLTEYADKIINILDGKIESVEIQTNSKEGKFPEFEDTKSDEKKTGKTSKSEKKGSKGNKAAKDGKDNVKPEQTVSEETPVTGGFNLEYETEKLEAAAQKLIDEEKAAKLAEQGLLEENTGQETDGFAKITQDDPNNVS